MPVFGQAFEGIETEEPGIGMVVGLDPPGKRSAACDTEFQIMYGVVPRDPDC